MKISQLGINELDNRVILSVIGYRQINNSVTNIPYIKRGEFALVTQVCIGEPDNNGKYSACIPVTNDILKTWDVSTGELFEKARQNSRKLMPAELTTIEEYIDMSEDFLMPDGNIAPNVFVLSNEYYFNGAAALFYQPDILFELGEQINKNVFAVLPTGQSEMYCIALDSKDSVKEYQALFESFIEEQLAADKDECIAKNIVCVDTNRRRIEQMDGVSYSTDFILEEETMEEKIHSIHNYAHR